MEHIKTQSNSEKHKEEIIEYRSLDADAFEGEIFVYNNLLSLEINIDSFIGSLVEDVNFTGERDYLVEAKIVDITDPITTQVSQNVFTAERDFLPTVWLIEIDPRDLEEIEIALDLMTHDKSAMPNYEDYLASVFTNPLASIVKISDLIHNLSHNPSERQIIKYRNALQKVDVPGHIKKSHLDELMGILDADTRTRGSS